MAPFTKKTDPVTSGLAGRWLGCPWSYHGSARLTRTEVRCDETRCESYVDYYRPGLGSGDVADGIGQPDLGWLWPRISGGYGFGEGQEISGEEETAIKSIKFNFSSIFSLKSFENFSFNPSISLFAYKGEPDEGLKSKWAFAVNFDFGLIFTKGWKIWRAN